MKALIKLLGLSLLIILASSLHAQPVSLEVAKKAADRFQRNEPFFKSTQKRNLKLNKVHSTNKNFELKVNKQNLFYLFDTDNNGFILVAGDKRLPPILGYSASGQANKKSMPPRLEEMLVSWRQRIDYEKFSLNTIEKSKKMWGYLLSENQLKAVSSDSISPLVKTKWGQGWPYNKFCPEDENGDNGHTLAGCNAVAIAQILNYWESPQKPHGTVEYESGSYGLQTVNFDEVTYDFTNMNDDAIAELMYHSAVATQSQFGAKSTSAYPDFIWNTLVPNFNYSPNAYSYYGLNYGWQEAFEIDINKELEAKRPILYSAWPSDTNIEGHTFIIDGRDNNELYHINWGWDGNYDGYYSHLLLNPGTNLFNGDQPYFIFEIEPGNNIYNDTSWSGTVLMDNSVMVMDGTTLTIEKGTTVKASKNSFIRVDGTLQALGEQNDSIRFTSVNEDEGWFGLSFRKTKLNLNDSCILNYSIIENCLMDESYLGKRILENFPSALSIVLRNNVFLENSTIQNNKGFEVGAINLYGFSDIDKRDITKLVINNSIIQKNMPSSVWGGGINMTGCEIEIKNSSISDNTINNYLPGSSGIGAGISVTEGNVFIENCIISGNSIKYEQTYPSLGGGIYGDRSNISIINSLIENNTSYRGGGIFIMAGSTTNIINSTFTENNAYEGPEILHDAQYMPHKFEILNSIISNTTNVEVLPIKLINQAKLDINNSFINNGLESVESSEDCTITSSNMLAGFPGFIDPQNNNYQLKNEAITVNSGTIFHLTEPLDNYKDLMGNDRVYGGKIDLGAYENQIQIAPGNISIEKDLVEIVLNEFPSDSIKVIPENIKYSDIILNNIPEYARISYDTIGQNIVIGFEDVESIADTFVFYIEIPSKEIPITVYVDSRPVLKGDLSGLIVSEDYIVIDDINIASDKSLVISPNTKLSFKNNSSLICEGVLNVDCNTEESVEFKGYKDQTWNGMVFKNLTNISDSSLLKGCIIRNVTINYENYVGAIDITFYPNLRIEECECFNNNAYNGAIHIRYNSDIIVRNNYIHHNQGMVGSAITVGNSEALIAYNKLMFNKTEKCNEPNGGALAIKQINCNFIEKDPYINGNEIAYNSGSFGGGISISTFNIESHPYLVNNLIYSNKADYGGGIFISSYYNDMLFPTLINNTIADNQSSYAAIYADPTAPLRIYNTAFYGNTNDAGNTANIMVKHAGPEVVFYYPELKNCYVEGGESSFFTENDLISGVYPEAVYEECISSEPFFQNPIDHNFNLQLKSPLIDMGTTEIQEFTFPEFDIQLKNRVSGKTIDIGCYENQIAKLIEYEICGNDSILYAGKYYSKTITLFDTLVSLSGNDSIIKFNLTVNPLVENAETITGRTMICQGETSVVYSVPEIANATSYVWTLPIGATGSSTTNNISVDYGLSAALGNISVYGSNSCGDGEAASQFITVNEKPPTPFINYIWNVLSSDAEIGNQWYDKLGLINGATEKDYTVSLNGDYYTIVTISGCNSEPSNIINVVNTGIGEEENRPEIKVYPNPVTNELIIEIIGNNENIDFEILNSGSQIIYRGKIVGKAAVNTRDFVPGIYIIKLKSGDQFEFKKVIKN